MWINVKGRRINTDNVLAINRHRPRKDNQIIVAFELDGDESHDILVVLDDEAQAETLMSWLDRFLNIADIAQMETDLEEPPTYIPF